LCLIIVFLILAFLEIFADRRQKSVSVELNFAIVFAFKHLSYLLPEIKHLLQQKVKYDVRSFYISASETRCVRYASKPSPDFKDSEYFALENIL
jgi:hypothetical protein